MKMKRLLVAAVALLGSVTLSGCGDLIAQLEQGLRDAAFNAILDEALQNGGTAALVRAGEPVSLAVTDPTSPIYGAKVEIPADGLPAGVTEAVLSLMHLQQLSLPDALVQLGAGVEISLVSFPQLAPITLTIPARATVPYGADVSDTTGLQVGHWDRGVNDWVFLANTAFGAGVVTGDTVTFSPFAAVASAPTETEEPVYTVTVTDATGVLCEEVYAAGEVTGSVTMYPFSAYSGELRGDQLDLSLYAEGSRILYIAKDWSVYIDGGLNGTETTPAGDVENAYYEQQTETCGTFSVWDDTPTNAPAITLSDWQQASVSSETCADNIEESCDTYTGSLTVSISQTQRVWNDNEDEGWATISLSVEVSAVNQVNQPVVLK